MLGRWPAVREEVDHRERRRQAGRLAGGAARLLHGLWGARREAWVMRRAIAHSTRKPRKRSLVAGCSSSHGMVWIASTAWYDELQVSGQPLFVSDSASSERGSWQPAAHVATACAGHAP